MFDVGLLVLVQMDLEEPGAVQLDPDPLADDLGGVDEVVEDGGVHGHEGAGAGPLLLQHVSLAGRLGEDPALGDEDDMLAGELLLELADQAGLDLLEGLALGHGDEDDDGLLAADLDLLGGGDVQLAQLGLEVGVDLEVEEGLRDRLLELVGLLAVQLDDLSAGRKSHHLERKKRTLNLCTCWW